MFIDYDPPKGAAPLSRGNLVAAIREAAPGLSDARLLWFPSASSCIWLGDREVRGVRGQRLWLLVADATDIPRAGALLRDRLWLTGHGRYDVSRAGALLERTLVDTSVWSPERLDFAGGAECRDGVEQRRGSPVRIDGTLETVDTKAALPDLTDKERVTLAKTRRAARALRTEESRERRDAWIAERVEEIGGDDPAAARIIARQALDYATLGGDFVLHVETPNGLESVTVATILSDRERWHGVLCRDPLEPEYGGGRMVGRLYLLQLKPTLHSFAHGGTTYRLAQATRTIMLMAGGTADAVNETIAALRVDPLSFDFGGQLATVEDGNVDVLTPDGAGYHLASVVSYERWSERDQRAYSCDPPAALIRQLLALGGRRKLRRLEAVVTAPMIRLDGTVLSRPGFDRQTGLLLDLPLGGSPAVTESPTLEDAREALATLMYPFSSFPFVDDGARGAMLAALLTTVTRAVLPTSVAFGFDAPVQGSGKTLLASCVGAMIEGVPPEIWPHTSTRDDEEIRKRLMTALRAGARSLIWDNVIGTLDSAAMAGFLTGPTMSDRVLGVMEKVTLPNKAMLILTGNNLSLAGDLPRRVLLCRIDPEMDTPFTRRFDLNPLQHCLDRRDEMAAAACTLIRARFTHPIPPAPGSIASFEGWDHLVRQTVVWVAARLGGDYADPMILLTSTVTEDPMRDAEGVLLEALHAKFGEGFFTSKDVASAATASAFGDGELADAVSDLLKSDRQHISAIRVGRALQYRHDRIVRGLCLKAQYDNHRKLWLYRVKEQPLIFRARKSAKYQPKRKLEGHGDNCNASFAGSSGSCGSCTTLPK